MRAQSLISRLAATATVWRPVGRTLPNSSRGPQLSANRTTERAGVRAVVEFFEKHHCVVQPVHCENDFGKDLYIDITRGMMITGTTFAVQVKAGTSYRAANGYRIPVGSHYECWRASNIPIIGVVHDSEKQTLHWANITAYLRECDNRPTSIPVPYEHLLSADGLKEIEDSCFSTAQSVQAAQHALAALWASDPSVCRQAVWDCLALGRHDFRYLLGLRASIGFLDLDLLPDALLVLAHLVSHPDIMWGKHNWVASGIKKLVLPTLRWTVAEVVLFVSVTDEWERGTLGQSVVSLLREDPGGMATTLGAVRQSYHEDEHVSWMAFCVYLHLCGEDAQQRLASGILEFPRFREHSAFPAVAECILISGSLPIAD